MLLKKNVPIRVTAAKHTVCAGSFAGVAVLPGPPRCGSAVKPVL